MDSQRTEACGRCSMTSVVGMTTEDGEKHGRSPLDGPRIELSDAELRQVSPHVVALGKVKHKLDEWATHIIYGR